MLSMNYMLQLEIESALDSGVGPEGIIFANTTKFPSHLRYASDHGIQLMTFDNEHELIKIHLNAPDSRYLFTFSIHL